jgi:hypothetical protein
LCWSARCPWGHAPLWNNTHNGYDTLAIALTSETAARPITDADLLAVAKIVWDTYPEHVDELRIRLNGEPAAFKRASLEREFGPRKAGMESGSDNSWWFIALGPLVCAAIVILIIVIVRRRRQRKPPADPPYPPMFPSPQP